MFYNDYCEFSKRINKFFEEEEWSELFREIHTLKGLAKLIGARKLSELAEKLNMKLKDQVNEAYLLQTYSALGNLLDEVLKETKTLIKY